jgi:hypothetical protein
MNYDQFFVPNGFLLGVLRGLSEHDHTLCMSTAKTIEAFTHPMIGFKTSYRYYNVDHSSNQNFTVASRMLHA